MPPRRLHQPWADLRSRSVDDKTRVPVAEMGNYVDFPELHYRNGATAFVGRGQDPDDAAALPEAAGVFISRPGNPIEIVVGRNSPMPGTNDECSLPRVRTPTHHARW